MCDNYCFFANKNTPFIILFITTPNYTFLLHNMQQPLISGPTSSQATNFLSEFVIVTNYRLLYNYRVLSFLYQQQNSRGNFTPEFEK